MSQIVNKFLKQAPTLTLKGNNTGGTANVTDLTVAQVNAILPVFTSSLNGLVPASGGGTINFLRADGTFAAPPGGGGSPVTASYYASSNGTSSTTQPINFDTQIYDTNSAVTTGSNWKFTAPSTGYYQIGGFLITSGNGNTYVYINGTQYTQIGHAESGAGSIVVNYTISLTLGDYFDLRYSASETYGGGSLTAQNTTSKITINLIK